ncbi:hypothetical protein NPIL_578931 [Nephila pilipes]|uniref:Uncharacterized protein n=1 Tax=Nephila pilipes TaxID=299642 RepID=A0A8X6U6H8_NEPPI|nr:hypothetical protein NPIL_13121 [Nephila pilipes]GFU35897.1 hypothetical protein NPIL_578931 [Nephila pilipes]
MTSYLDDGDSETSLKAGQLHYVNTLSSVAIACSFIIKESYENMLHEIDYSHHNSNISADIKVITVLIGLQQGYTKRCCFLWSRTAEQNINVISNRSDQRAKIKYTKRS